MGAGFFELCPPLSIDQAGRRVRKCVGWIAACGMALRFDKNRPTGFETTQGIVQTAGYCDKFGWHGAIEIRPPELCCPLERPILVEDDPLINKSRPRQKIREPGVGTAVFGEIHHETAHVLR